MTEQISDIAQDPKTRGKLQALRSMTDDLQKQITSIREKKSEQNGAKKASERIAATLQGLQDELRKDGVKNGLDPADVKTRVNLVARCRDLAIAQAGDAGKELAMLDGEARAMQRQIDSVRSLHSAAVADEQRKARIAAQEKEEKRQRAAKARAAREARKKEAKKKTGTKKAPAKRASKPRKAAKSKKG